MNNRETLCYVGLGCNLGACRAQLRAGLAGLSAIAESRLIAYSSLYRSRPLGPQNQPDYLNAVAAVATGLMPMPLLDALLAIEREQGRVRECEQRWGPRTLDLDILLYGDQLIASSALTVPHPRLSERSFVLYPLAEIAPDVQIPGRGPLRELLEQCSAVGLQRLEGDWA